jgi:hypothetical protein
MMYHHRLFELVSALLRDFLPHLFLGGSLNEWGLQRRDAGR